MYQEKIHNHEEEMILLQLKKEIPSLPKKILSPKILGNDDLVFFHEGGHATIALLFNVPIDAYNVSGKLKWVSKYAPLRKKHYASIRLSGNEGVVSYRPTALTLEQQRLMSAGGVASELSHFGHIGSMTSDQEGDRKKGGFKNIFEIQAVADPLADRFDTDLNILYRFSLNRIAQNKGFDDINQLIDREHKVVKVFGITEQALPF